MSTIKILVELATETEDGLDDRDDLPDMVEEALRNEGLETRIIRVREVVE